MKRERSSGLPRPPWWASLPISLLALSISCWVLVRDCGGCVVTIAPRGAASAPDDGGRGDGG